MPRFESPISASFLFLCAVLLLAQIYVRLRKPKALGRVDTYRIHRTMAARVTTAR
jgi:hypothetical protein